MAYLQDNNRFSERMTPVAKAFEEAKVANVEMRYTIYPGQNHNSVRLASFPAGLYWVYRPWAAAR